MSFLCLHFSRHNTQHCRDIQQENPSQCFGLPLCSQKKLKYFLWEGDSDGEHVSHALHTFWGSSLVSDLVIRALLKNLNIFFAKACSNQCNCLMTLCAMPLSFIWPATGNLWFCCAEPTPVADARYYCSRFPDKCKTSICIVVFNEARQLLFASVRLNPIPSASESSVAIWISPVEIKTFSFDNGLKLDRSSAELCIKNAYSGHSNLKGDHHSYIFRVCLLLVFVSCSQHINRRPTANAHWFRTRNRRSCALTFVFTHRILLRWALSHKKGTC